MSRTRDIVQEILEIRGRRTTDIPSFVMLQQILKLNTAFEKRKDIPDEVLKYFPVALVALMEGYFRVLVKQFVDHGDPYLANAEKLFSGKVDFGVLRALHGRQVSLGEVIAHTLNLNSLSHIDSHLSGLIGVDFLAVVRTVSDRWDHEVLGNPIAPVLNEPNKTFAQVARMFELRHIVCHEAATTLTMDLVSIEEGFVHTSLFLKASEEVASAALYPNAPLTQADMNIAAGKDLREMLANVESYRLRVRELLELDDQDRVASFDAVNALWNDLTEAWANFEADEYRLGSIRPVIYAGAARRVAAYRLDLLKLCEKQLEL